MKSFFTLLFTFSLFVSLSAQFTTQGTSELMTDVQVVDNNTAYAVGSSLSGTDEGFLYKRTGSTGDFTVVNFLPEARFVGCHFFDARNGLICGTSSSGRSYIWRTTDGGATLTQRLISPLLSFYPVASTTTTNGVGNYQFKSNSFGDYRISATAVGQPASAPTYFGNVLNLNLATVIEPTDCKTYPANITLISTNATVDFMDKSLTINVYPNPFSNELVIDIETEKSETVAIQLINLNGIVLQTWTQTVNAPRSTMTVQPNIQSGVYLMKIQNQAHEAKILRVIKAD
jgi:Secretion system C-terminal sorting domain